MALDVVCVCLCACIYMYFVKFERKNNSSRYIPKIKEIKIEQTIILLTVFK